MMKINLITDEDAIVDIRYERESDKEECRLFVVAIDNMIDDKKLFLAIQYAKEKLIRGEEILNSFSLETNDDGNIDLDYEYLTKDNILNLSIVKKLASQLSRQYPVSIKAGNKELYFYKDGEEL